MKEKKSKSMCTHFQSLHRALPTSESDVENHCKEFFWDSVGQQHTAVLFCMEKVGEGVRYSHARALSGKSAVNFSSMLCLGLPKPTEISLLLQTFQNILEAQTRGEVRRETI